MMYLTMLETTADQAILQKLYEENRTRLYFTAWKILRNEANAEDAVHDGFLKLANNFARYRDQSYENLLKIWRIAVKNAAIDLIRENEKKCSFSEENGFTEDCVADVAPDILDAVIREQEKDLVAQALLELDEKERELIYFQYVAGIKPKEIGEMLGLSSAVVRKKMFVSRNKLAKILESKGYEGLSE